MLDDFHNIPPNFIPWVYRKEAVFLSRYVKGVPFFTMESIQKGNFSVKNSIKKGKGLDLRAEPLQINFVEYPPGFALTHPPDPCMKRKTGEIRDETDHHPGDYVWGEQDLRSIVLIRQD